MNRGFTPHQVADLEADVQRRATAIVDAVAEKGECDFVSEVAAALPLQIICDMMGIPESEYQLSSSKTNVVLGVGDPEYGGDIMQAFLAAQELWTYAQELRARIVSTHPRDDITTKITQAEVEGHSLTPEEFGSFFVLLVVAGNETTRNAISHGMKALTRQPRPEAPVWLDDIDGVSPSAVEEVIRWSTPVVHFRRTCATADAEVGGQPIKEGEKVVLWYSAANRDASVFDDPVRVRRASSTRTSTSGSVAAARTSVSARTSPGARSGDVRGAAPAAPRHRGLGRARRTCSRTSSTASSGCR